MRSEITLDPNSTLSDYYSMFCADAQITNKKNTMKTMTRTEKRNTLLLAKVTVSPLTVESEKAFFKSRVKEQHLALIVTDDNLWKGYQSYNALMKESGDTDYKHLTSKEVLVLREEIKKEFNL